MRISRIVKLILSLQLLSFCLFAQEQVNAEVSQDEVGSYFELGKPLSFLEIEFDQNPGRYFFTLQNEVLDVTIKNLEPGASYQIFLSPETSDCLPNILYPESETDLVIQFEAQSTAFSFQIDKPCEMDLPMRITVGCNSCPKAGSQLNPIGLMVDENYSAVELIRDVFVGGDCFDVDTSSITYVGDNLGAGYFSNGTSSINIEDGIILATGDIYNSAGPNDDYNAGNSFLTNVADPDLTSMVNTSFVYDMASLEFDFTPTTDQISFEFVFASEEYCEYANSNFNDAFGFFISGPGINGPFSNNAENIAIVPNTNDYTAINTVNHLNNPNYYVNNIPVSQHDDIPVFIQCAGYPVNTEGVAVSEIQYDGFTTVMTAQANVQACETYHIKLVIADVSDGYFDSAVLLKANSFSAGDVAEVSTQAPGGGMQSNIAYEDCQESFFIFERPNDDLSEPLTVSFTIDPVSTAMEGIDYATLPNSITIPAGDSVYYLPVTVFPDLFTEGTETIVLEFEAPCSCALPYVVMYIEDIEPLAVVTEDQYFCDPVSLSIEPQTTGGVGNYTYTWNTGDTTATLNIYADQNVSYSVTVTDECGHTAVGISNVSVIESPTAMISGYELVCPENPNAQILIEFTGTGPWDLIYSIDNIIQPTINGITDNPFVLETSTLGIYQLLSVNTFDCNGAVQGAATVAPVDFAVDHFTNDESCPGTQDGSIAVTVNGGTQPYTFNWDNGLPGIQNPGDLAAGLYNLVISDANGCTTDLQVEVNLAPGTPQADAGPALQLTCATTAVILDGTATTGGNYTYQWTTSNGNITAGANTLNPEVNQAGLYNLEVTNVLTNCTVIDEVEVSIDTTAPIPEISVIGPLEINCTNPSTILDGTGSQPFGSLGFMWTSQDGNIQSGANTAQAEVNAGGTYQLLVTNLSNGCTATENYTILADINLPEINIQTPGVITCLDSMITLEAGNSSSGTNYTILWTSDDGNIVNGNNTLFPTVDQPGVYELTIFNTSNDCENTASVLVTEDRIAPIAEAGLTTELGCNDETASLDAGQSSVGGEYYYEWNTMNGTMVSGMQTLYPEVSAAGVYTLVVTNTRNGCTAEDDVLVIEDSDVPNAADIEIFEPQCFGDLGGLGITNVYGGSEPYIYSIDGGASFHNESLFLGLPPGEVELQIQDADGCLYTTTLFIPSPPQLFLDLEPEAEINLGDSYQINATTNIPEFLLDSISWAPGPTLSCTNCLDPIAFPFETTNYQITILDQNGCLATANILIRVDKDRKIFIPNAFSPNGDGANDRFAIFAKEGLVTKINRFQVFNRWGAKVFEARDIQPNDLSSGWDGTMKGQVVNPSVFIYHAEIEFIDGETILYKGDVTVTD